VDAPAAENLTDAVAFDPAEDLGAFLKRVPARWVVYLLSDAEGEPIQLLCVKNLRSSLKRRLGGQEQVGPSKRVDYRDIVRQVHWRRVDSAFEADLVYYETARRCFPQSYQGMVGFRPAWFVHVDPDVAFPRYTKTIDLDARTGTLIGPLEDKHAAARLIQLIEDAFDLCRYYNILVESPNAKACAYKEMGKCPAPCDGAISMDQYRRMIEWSAQVAVDPAAFVQEQTERMERAAAELRFESAGKIKAFIERVSQLGKGAFRHARRLEEFRFVSIQRGPREGTAKVFLISQGEVEEICGCIALDAPLSRRAPGHGSQASRLYASTLKDVLSLIEAVLPRPQALDRLAVERIGIVSHHLFLAKQSRGAFLRLGGVNDKTLAKALADLQKQQVKETAADDDDGDDDDDEGLLKELQTI
jgi:hypothetical protein